MTRLVIKIALMLFLAVAATTASADLVRWFSTWDDVIRESPDIVVVRCLGPGEASTNDADQEDFSTPSKIEVLMVLKGEARPGSAQMKSLYQPAPGQRLLFFSTWETNRNEFHGLETFHVVPISETFSLDGLAGKSLDEQIKLVLQRRLTDLEKSANARAEELARLRQWTNISSHARVNVEPPPASAFASAQAGGTPAQLDALDLQVESLWPDKPIEYFQAKQQVWDTLAAIAKTHPAALPDLERIGRLAGQKSISAASHQSRECLGLKIKMLTQLTDTNLFAPNLETARVLAATVGNLQESSPTREYVFQTRSMLYRYCQDWFARDPQAAGCRAELGQAAGLSAPETGQLGMRF